MYDPAQNVFCWRCHGYQQTTQEGTVLNIAFPERCLDVTACRKQWDDMAKKAAEDFREIAREIP